MHKELQEVTLKIEWLLFGLVYFVTTFSGEKTKITTKKRKNSKFYTFFWKILHKCQKK